MILDIHHACGYRLSIQRPPSKTEAILKNEKRKVDEKLLVKIKLGIN